MFTSKLCAVIVATFSLDLTGGASCTFVYDDYGEKNDFEKDDTFMYFGYGSNLLAKRIRINNPSAVFYKPAKLNNYRLDFAFPMKAWQGGVATIVEDNDAHVWGALWTLDSDQIRNIDRQEGVDKGWYKAINVTVTTDEGKEVLARTYELVNNPPKVSSTCLPCDRQPSNSYLMVICLGAIESKLPSDYIGFLFSFATNNKQASDDYRNKLGYPFV